MLYSNEVILYNTCNARYTNFTTFADIDMSLDGVYNLSNTIDIDYSPNDTVKKRLFKIIDIIEYSLRSLNITRNPLGVLIQSVDNPSIKIVCKASDLLYMGKNLLNFTYKRRPSSSSVQEDIVLTILGSEELSRDSTDSIEHYLANRKFINTPVHRAVQRIWRKGKFVDKNDSRLTYNRQNRFYLHRVMSTMLSLLFRYASRNQKSIYNPCRHCDFIDIDSDLKKFLDYKVCVDCYQHYKVSCDVCDEGNSISNTVDIESLILKNDSRKDILEDAEINKCCNRCFSSFYLSCHRCKTIEYIDFNRLRRYPDKSDYLLHFKANNKNFSTVFSTTYCNPCATQSLNQHLYHPFRGLRIPTKYGTKSEFNRFVGIESEVISNYDNADHYIDDGYIPKHFMVVDDGSLSTGGVEFKTSKPIIGKQVSEALYSLETVNLDEYNSVDSSCGVHIHMNAIDFTFIELKSLLMIMTKIQDSIYDTLPTEREHTYCRELSWSINELQKIKNLPTLVNRYYKLADTNITDEKYNEGRYIGTNLHARFFLGTIEFRYHEGTIYSEPIKNWIRFLNRIMKTSTTLVNNNTLYNKIISNKIQPIDVIRDMAGNWGVEYIENRISNKQ